MIELYISLFYLSDEKGKIKWQSREIAPVNRLTVPLLNSYQELSVYIIVLLYIHMSQLIAY